MRLGNMREIKLRAWDGSNMKYFKLFEGQYAGYPIMQYTGLKDKNETPIWEGDIVKCDIGGLVYGDMSEVTFYHGIFGVTIGYDLIHNALNNYETVYESNGFEGDKKTADMLNDIEVIGNKFENPELLEQ